VNLRDYARGQQCFVRLPGICNFDSETTVLAHLRRAGISGMGQKAPDLLGAFCCSACHDEVDRRTRLMEYEAVKLAFFEGIVRTQARLISDGLVSW
jgi:hypothetical protein